MGSVSAGGILNALTAASRRSRTVILPSCNVRKGYPNTNLASPWLRCNVSGGENISERGLSTIEGDQCLGSQSYGYSCPTSGGCPPLCNNYDPPSAKLAPPPKPASRI